MCNFVSPDPPKMRIVYMISMYQYVCMYVPYLGFYMHNYLLYLLHRLTYIAVIFYVYTLWSWAFFAFRFVFFVLFFLYIFYLIWIAIFADLLDRGTCHFVSDRETFKGLWRIPYFNER